MLDLRKLRAFIALAETGSFRRAAQKVFLTQPALSQAIRALEKELKVELVRRRPFGLTPAGEVLLEEGRALLRQAQLLEERVRKAGQQGVRVGVPENLLLDLLPLLDALRKALKTPVEVLEMHTPEQVLALKEGRLDYGLAGLKVEDEGIAVEPLLEVPFYVALPEDHPLAQEEAVELARLREEPFILMPKEALPPLYEAFMEVFKEAGFQPRVVREAVRFPQGISLVAAGIGVYPFLAPYRYLPHPGAVLKPLWVGGRPPGLRVALIYRKDPVPPHLEAVRESLRTFLEGGSGQGSAGA